jgi:hypothetical protein
MSGHRRLLVASLLVLAGIGACSSGPANPSIAINLPPTPVLGATATAGDPTATGGPIGLGGDLCGLLGPGDFAGAGVHGATTPLDNFDDSGNHFCSYAETASGSIGIEFDAFVSNPAAAYQSMVNGGGLKADDATAQLLGVDSAASTAGDPAGATIAACKGRFCFEITIPAASAARAQLIGLARLVLERAGPLAS